MKRLITYFIGIYLLSSCSEDTISVGIDVQSFFNQDIVQITIDNKEVLNRKLQTGNILAVCSDGRINVNLTEGNHVIKIIINNLTTKTETFLLTKALYVGVNYNEQTKEISLIYSDHPFGYR